MGEREDMDMDMCVHTHIHAYFFIYLYLKFMHMIHVCMHTYIYECLTKIIIMLYVVFKKFINFVQLGSL